MKTIFGSGHLEFARRHESATIRSSIALIPGGCASRLAIWLLPSLMTVCQTGHDIITLMAERNLFRNVAIFPLRQTTFRNSFVPQIERHRSAMMQRHLRIALLTMHRSTYGSSETGNFIDNY